MLAVLGFIMVATFMAAIMTRRMSALVALVLVPVAFALATGHAHDLGAMTLAGVQKLAPTAALLMFAILYFSIVSDAGMFEPLVRAIVRLAAGDPLRVLVGTVVMGFFVALDGDGATTYVICVSALLPLYARLGIQRLYMATLLLMVIGIMNIMPWGGPTSRAATALGVEVSVVFLPLIPVMLFAAVYVLGIAVVFGLHERRRLGVLTEGLAATDAAAPSEHQRPRRMLINLVMTATLLIALVMALLPLHVLFMIATMLALLVNYPTLEEQKLRLQAHAYNVIAVIGLIFAAGVFTGVLDGTGMLPAMSASLLKVIPPDLGPYLAPVTAVLSGVATYFVTNDAFYFGVLPVLAWAAEPFGITEAQMARASLLGQPLHLLSPLVASTYLLASLLDLNYADVQRRSLLAVVGLMAALILGALIFQVIPLNGLA